MSTTFADSRTEVQRYRHIDNGYHSHLLISAIFKDNERTTVSCGGAQGVLLLSFFFVKSDTHYKNPWSHAKLFLSPDKCDSMVKLSAELLTLTGRDFGTTIKFNASTSE